MSDSITIEQIDYHRNGISGEGFHVVLFTQLRKHALEDKKAVTDEMFAVVFGLDIDDEGEDAHDRGEFYNCPTAVFDRGLLAEGNIKFAQNSFRGDVYDLALRDAIKEASEAWTLDDGYNSVAGKEYKLR